MLIQWFGQSFFKISTKNQLGQEITIAIDPFDKETGLKMPSKFGADILLITHDHHDHNNIELIKGAGDSGEPFLISGPGEYEIKGVMIYGVQSFHDDENGAKNGENTIYILESEGIWLAHLGDLGQKKLSEQQLEHLQDIDIVILPVGGEFTLGSSDAAKLASELEPRVIIPMHYKLPGLKANLEGVEKFVKAVGLKPEEMEKFKVQKKDLPEEETKLVILQN
jgi:L-ascorbate metabolism protein UlaG (beta-lactamase superfamily)